MSTLYDLFKVKENASNEEIENSYNRIVAKANQQPQTEKLIGQIRRIEIAYGILSDDEKRKKYDKDLANKRAEELLQNLQVKEDENCNSETVEYKDENISDYSNDNNEILKENEEKIKQAINLQIDKMLNVQSDNEKQKKEEEKQKKEEEKQRKREFKKSKREEKKKKEIEKEMEIRAYGDYLSKQGYRVKYPWTWRRIKRLLISILFVIIVMFVLWNIPSVRKNLIKLYDENVILRYIINLIVSIFEAIASGIKGIFK